MEEQVFDTSYEETLAALEIRSRSDSFSLEQIRNELRDLYKFEGLDWTGRGGLKQAEIGGTILAYQAFLHRRKGDEE